MFILPPSYEELERRLRGRNTDAPEVIAQRLSNARREIRELVWYDYLVVNDDFDRAVEALRSIIVAEGCRAPRRMAEARRLFDLP
jgi:guanylate kinase